LASLEAARARIRASPALTRAQEAVPPRAERRGNFLLLPPVAREPPWQRQHPGPRAELAPQFTSGSGQSSDRAAKTGDAAWKLPQEAAKRANHGMPADFAPLDFFVWLGSAARATFERDLFWPCRSRQIRALAG